MAQPYQSMNVMDIKIQLSKIEDNDSDEVHSANMLADLLNRFSEVMNNHKDCIRTLEMYNQLLKQHVMGMDERLRIQESNNKFLNDKVEEMKRDFPITI